LLAKPEADRLNQESGRLYTRALVEHYRVYRQTGQWLSPAGLEKLVDFYDAQAGQDRLLHAHSIDAAEQGFPKACKTARAYRKLGLKTRFPYKRKYWRTTIWKNSGIRKADKTLLLALARGRAPLRVSLPSRLVALPPDAFAEMRLVWDKVSRRYHWHLVIEDGQLPAAPPGDQIAAVDLGEVHPAAVTDGQEALVVSARALRSARQYTHKRLASLQQAHSRKTKGSRQWQKLQRRKNRFLAQQKRLVRDIEHKVSRAVVDWAVEHRVGTLAIGDVRDIADGKRLPTKTQQKIGSWGHGQTRQYIAYKAEGAGITVEFVDEAYSSQTCPVSGHRHKTTGRIYSCPDCGFRGHRDGQVGAVNLLSRHIYGAVGQIQPPSVIKYRHPIGRLAFRTGKRSRPTRRMWLGVTIA
jgi:putative transposase